MGELRRILIAEDNEADLELTLTALADHKLANEVVVVRDGVEVLDFLYRRGPFADRVPGNPAVLLLDLKMPRMDGIDVLRQVKQDPALRSVPIVILTSSREESDLVDSYRLGANAYVVKPVEFAQFVEAVRRVGIFWALVNEPPPGLGGRAAMSRKVRVLLLEDVPEDAAIVQRLLEEAGVDCEVSRAAGREEFAAGLADPAVDLVLADHALPGFDGSSALALARKLRPEVPFIVVSGTIGEEHAIEMLRQGATDYVLKDRLSRLAPAVKRALREAEEHAARRRAEEAMRLQREMLLRNEHLEAVASVVGGVAHELNNPLALLVGHATLLRRKAGEGPLAERADKILEAAERCSRIVRNFLALARRHPSERQPVDLPPLVRETLEILAYGPRVDGISVSIDLPDRMPRLPGEPDRLRQVLVNLVMNAQHALRQRPAGRRLEVRLETEPQAQLARLVVEDNGPGIPDDLRERIFEPFFTTKAAGEGTGLGLPLCRTIVEDHGGVLRVESVPGGGARFVAELAISAPSTAAPAAPAGDATPGPRKILVVDDEPDLGALMADALALAGHTVEAVTTTSEAIDRLRRQDYDLVLSDVRMPDMDGPRLYQEVQRLRPGRAPRFVFVTGDTLAPATATFLRKIGAPVVSKPFALEELVQTAGRALGA